MEQNLLNPKPYERPGAMQFIKFAKTGNWELVGDMLFINRYHAFDVDHIGQTALHWAAKRGYAEVIVKMMEAGADVDKEDIVRYYKRVNVIEWQNTLIFCIKRQSFRVC